MNNVNYTESQSAYSPSSTPSTTSTATTGSPGLARALDWAGSVSKFAGIKGAILSKGLREASEYLRTNDVNTATTALRAKVEKNPVKSALIGLAGVVVLNRMLKRR